MVEHSKNLTRKLLDLMKETGYPLVQQKGQRKYGPPPEWVEPPPPKGCEVFVGKLPREIFEDELVPIFGKCGKIYEMRLMMDSSGSNRGYAFVTFTNRSDASRAVKQLNKYEIRLGRCIAVEISVDNCKIFVGRIPKTKTKEEVLDELLKLVTGIVDVLMPKNYLDRRLNRGYVFVQFTSHQATAIARRELIMGRVKLWNLVVHVDWAELEPYVDYELMKKVKALYVRNFLIGTTEDTIKCVFEAAIASKIERIKKIYDYAFIHFHHRDHAELAMNKLQNSAIEGSNIEIRWAKPVNRDLYRIQKQSRGNAKFNSLDLKQTLLLYEQHLDQEYANQLIEDEGIASAYYGGSQCGSPTDGKTLYSLTGHNEQYSLAPAKLYSVCKRYSWVPPVYEYERYTDPCGVEIWICRVVLPQVGQPLYMTKPRHIGPLTTSACYSAQQAQVEAAEKALQVIQSLRSNLIQYVTPTPITSVYMAPWRTMVPQMPTSVGLQYYDYMNASPCRQLPVVPTLWRNV